MTTEERLANMERKLAATGRRSRWLLVALVLVGASFFVVSCKRDGPGAGAKGDELRVIKVEVEGKVLCSNETLAPFSWTVNEKGRPAGLLARDGDDLSFVGYGEEGTFLASSPLCYRATDGTVLTVAFEKGRMLLGGKTVSVDLDEKAGWNLLRQASEEDLKGLRFLAVGQSVNADQLEILEKVAKTHPTIVLGLEPPWATEEGAATPTAVGTAEVLRLFRPHFLIAEASLLSEEMDKIRLALEDVEVLFLRPERLWRGGNYFVDAKGGNLDFLAHMPRLRRLYLSDWTPERAPLPQGLKNLRSLVLVDTKSPVALASIADLEQLEQLILVGGNIEDLGGLAKFPRLKTLSLRECEKVMDLGSLKDVPLEYLSFPPKISQEQFNVIVHDHPGLRAVELFGCWNVKDIAALKGLKNLEALSIYKCSFEEGEKHLADLKELKGLRLLVLPQWEGEEANAKIAELQLALPGCLISAGKLILPIL